MKLSITLTLATLASISVGSEARIGGGEKYEIYVANTCHNDVTAREQNKHQGSVVKASSCKLWDSGTTESLQSFIFDTQSNKAGAGSVQCQKKPNPYECQQFMMHKKLPDNACVIKVPSSMCDDRNRQLEDPEASKAAEEKERVERAAARKAAEEKERVERAAARKAAEEKERVERAAARKAAEEKERVERAAARKEAEEKERVERAAARKAAEDAGHHHRSLETASESSPNDFFVYIAIEKYHACPNCKVGLLDQSGARKNDFVIGDAECVLVGLVGDHGDINNPDSLSYFVETPYGGFSPGNANCTDIGNKNNLKCSLHPENACVILG